MRHACCYVNNILNRCKYYYNSFFFRNFAAILPIYCNQFIQLYAYGKNSNH